MNNLLKQNNYIIIPNFISSYKTNKLYEEYRKYYRENPVNEDPIIPNTCFSIDHISFLELLCEKTPEVSEILEESVLPTYSYVRVYKNGSKLHKHSDRDACEISFTVHLGGDKSWPIWIKTPSNESVSVTLNPGDAMMYLGCEAEHWREEYDGQEYIQVFLHYVRSRGDKSYAYFDKVKEDPLQKVEDSSDSTASNETKKDFSTNILIPTKTLEDFIFVFDDIMSEDLCKTILNEYKDSIDWQSASVGENYIPSIDESQRNCSEIYLSLDCVKQKNFEMRSVLDREIFNSVSKSFQKYIEIFPTLNITLDTGYTLLKYEEGQFYKQHTDSFVEQQRSISCSIQLNDDYEGGEFAFFNQNIQIKGKVGSAIVFPSNFMYPHEIMPVTKGTRYSLISWGV